MEDIKQIIKKLIARGMTYQKIGEMLGVSRQRIHQLYKGYSTKKINPDTSIPIDWLPIENFEKGNLGKFSGRNFLKEIVRRRDNQTCQICGKKWEEGQRRFDVHHLDESLEGKNGMSYEACKNFNRQITLCHKCHLNLKHIKEKFRKRRKIKKVAERKIGETKK